MFINRKKELMWLKQLSLALQRKKGINGAILGLRRIGKTDLLLEFKRRNRSNKLIIPYLNIQSSISSPKRFCLDFISVLLEETCILQKINLPLKQTIEEDLPVIAGRLSETLYDYVIKVINLLNKSEFEESLRLMFKLPERVAETFGINILFFIDEIQELDNLKHYKIDPFALMRVTVEKQTESKYVVTGSLVSFMEELFMDPNKPFFNQFSLLTLSLFSKEDTTLLARHLWEYDFIEVEDNSYSKLFQLSSGHPFYTVAICERAFFESKYCDFKINADLIEYAFIKETLSHEGKLNILFEYIFNHSLEKVERKGSLKQPLLVLADEEGLTLSEISKKLNKPSGQVSNLLKSLLKSDLVVRKDNKYHFRDSILRFWLAKTSLGKDPKISFDKNVINNYISDLQERYMAKSSEHGRAKEFELYYFINENKGKNICGVKLPRFNKIIKNYITPEGNEIDLFAINTASWAFELKWKNKRVGRNEIEKFIQKINANTYVYISKNGYTEQATRYAIKNNVTIWQGSDLF
ncbi:restriction endonuclease [bacterium]|nr:restriction endonuclease [bacterium]